MESPVIQECAGLVSRGRHGYDQIVTFKVLIFARTNFHENLFSQEFNFLILIKIAKLAKKNFPAKYPEKQKFVLAN